MRRDSSRFAEDSGLRLVGAAGLEPATLGSQSRCASQLRYAPIPSPVGAHCAHVVLDEQEIDL